MRRIRRRSATSLLELIAVVTLLGIVASISIASYRRGTLGNAYAKTDATRVATDARLARQKAISTGDNHFLQFNGSGAGISYQVFRRYANGSVEAAAAPYTFNSAVTVTVSPSNPEFTFEGEGLAGYTIVIRGPDRTNTISINQVTGAVQLTAS